MRITTSELTRTRATFTGVGVGLSTLALLGFLWVQSPPSPVESIRAEELRVKVSRLASDQYRGRGNGTPELDAAADYIADGFRDSGLAPAGNDGYFQNFQVDRLSLGAENRLEVKGAPPPAFEAGRDYVPYPGSVDGMAEGSMVFVGYGVRAPQLDYDDLEGVSLDGKIAVVLDGYPRPRDRDSRFNALSDEDLSNIFLKAENVAEAGAVALIVVQGPLGGATVSIGYLSGALRPGLSPRRSIMELPAGPDDPQIPILVVSRDASARLIPDLRVLQSSIDTRLETRTLEVVPDVVVEADFDRDSYTARNVLAKIEGSDPELQDEVLLVGAHYDHDGEENGLIWHGADDDASGTSGLLELAEAFSLGAAPARSVLLAAWAGEEKGMLGSRSYVREPAIPIEDTAAMFQIDMIGRNEEHSADPGEGFLLERASLNGNAMNVIGSVFSPDLRSAVERVNSAVGLDLHFRYDYRAQNLIRRSDHWTFLSRRVPALFFFGGLHPDYHTPNDTADKINYSKIEKVVRLVYLSLLELGNAPRDPRFVNPSAEQ